MLNFSQFKKLHLKEHISDANLVQSEDDLLLLYANYIGEALEHQSLLVRDSVGVRGNIGVEALALDIGRFNAKYCLEILDAERVFVVENKSFGFTFVGANGKQEQWYNELASLLWALVFDKDEPIFGDILLIRNEDFIAD